MGSGTCWDEASLWETDLRASEIDDCGSPAPHGQALEGDQQSPLMHLKGHGLRRAICLSRSMDRDPLLLLIY